MSKFVQPSITRVSRAIRAETISIFYGANTFFLNSSNCRNWLAKIRPYARFVSVQMGPNSGMNSPLLERMLDMDLVVRTEDGKRVLSMAAVTKVVELPDRSSGMSSQ